MSAPRTLLALLVVFAGALLPAAAMAAPSRAVHGIAGHSAHHRCARHRAGRRGRACRASHRRAAGTRRSGPQAGRAADTHGRAGRGSHRRRRHSRTPQTTSAVHVVTPAVVAQPAVPASTAPCADADLTPASDDLAAVQAATLCLVNQVRGQHGLAALALDSRLQSAAVRHNSDMVAQDYFDHTGPAGDTPLTRIRDSGYLGSPDNGYEVGENIAWGTGSEDTPRAIVQAWVNSPDHLANILDAKYTATGLAVAAQAPASAAGSDAGATYTQDFGGIDPSTA